MFSQCLELVSIYCCCSTTCRPTTCRTGSKAGSVTSSGSLIHVLKLGAVWSETLVYVQLLKAEAVSSQLVCTDCSRISSNWLIIINNKVSLHSSQKGPCEMFSTKQTCWSRPQKDGGWLEEVHRNMVSLMPSLCVSITATFKSQWNLNTNP